MWKWGSRVAQSTIRGLRAFREEFLKAYLNEEESILSPDNFGSIDARRVRYAILWAYYNNDVYRDVNNFARTYKTRFSLGKYIRNIYNPAYRLAEFYRSYLWGRGEDGIVLPIATDNQEIIEHLQKIWKWSNWRVRSDTVALYGTVMGDVFLRVVDAPEAEKVYLSMINPSTITHLDKDEFGNVKGYVLEEERISPENGKAVRYTEVAERRDGAVVYSTYMNDVPYPWNDEAISWAVEYDFVPVVHLQHNDVGIDWGYSEFQPVLSKVREVDDLASALGDQVRRGVNPAWLLAGVKQPSSSLAPTGRTRDATSRPDPGREETPMLYANDSQAKPHALVPPVDLEGTVLHINSILSEIERDYPELRFDNLRASGEVSGKSLRVARQPAETKIKARRDNYDDALMRAQQMALTIGGIRGYFPGISLDSYATGALDHSIGDRPVFEAGEEEKLEMELAFWNAAKVAKETGMPLTAYLAHAGWSEEKIAELEKHPEMLARLGLLENLGG